MAKQSGSRLSNKRPKLNIISNGQEEAEEDRLSALPDCLLHHILSFLGTEQVAMTSLLSKRWQFLWTEIPVLDLCQRGSSIVDFFDRIRFADKFVHRVGRMLVICNRGHHLDKFAVDFWYATCFSSALDHWVQFLIQTKVKNVTLMCRPFSPYITKFYMLPEILYSYSSLTSLTIGCVDMNHQVAIEWGSLRTLSLDEVALSESLMTNILSGCPVLEVLHLKGCRGLSYLNICSSNLTTLVIDGWFGMGTYGPLLEISAPYIRVLSVTEKNAREVEFRFKNISSVVRANLDFHRHKIQEPGSSTSEMNYIKRLIKSLKSVKDLELGPWFIEALSSMEVERQKFPPSTRRCLTINAWDHTRILPGIMGMLKSSPNLETLIITGNCTPREVFFFNDPRYRAATYMQRGKLDLVACHLKTVKITGFTETVLFDVPMLELVQMLLKSAKVLRTMVISAEGDSIKASSTSTGSNEGN